MTGFADILLNGSVGAIGFFGGRYWEKRDHCCLFINEKVNKLTADIGELSITATKYYIYQMDERTTSAETALIGGALKRINIELHSLCQLAKVDTADFMGVVFAFHQAVTGEPYGAKSITPIDANDRRITEIQDAETAYIRKLKSLEKV